MPRLPDVTALGQRPQIRDRFVRVDQYTEGTGRAVAQFGAVAADAVGQTADEITKRQDTEAVFEARRALDEWERKAIHDPVNGAAQKSGKDAFGVPDELGKSFDTEVAKIGEGLQSGRARRAFQEMATSRRAQVGEWAARHAGQQRKVYEQQGFEADVASMQDRAVRLAAMPPDGTPEGAMRQAAEVRAELAIGQQRIVSFLRGRGMPEEAITEAVKTFSSKVHAGTVGALITQGNAERAREYLDANAAEMKSGDVVKLRGDMRELMTRQRAQAFGDEIEADIEGGKMTLGAALDKAREKFPADSPEREAAVAQVKQRFSEVEAAKAEAKKGAVDAAWKVLTNGGRRKDIRPDLWNQLPGEEQRHINDWLEAKWRRAKADAEGKHETNWTKFAEIVDMATDPARQSEFLATDPAVWEPYLNKGDMAKVISLRAGINKDQAKAGRIAVMMQGAIDSIQNELRSAGFNTRPKPGTSEAKKWDEFSTQLRLTLVDAAAEKDSAGKGALDDKEMRAIGLRMLATGTEQGSGFFGFGQTKKRGYEIAAERAAALEKGEQPKSYVAATFDNIPAGIRDDIIRDQFPNAARSIYGGREVQLTSDQKARVEMIYTRGRERGVF